MIVPPAQGWVKRTKHSLRLHPRPEDGAKYAQRGASSCCRARR